MMENAQRANDINGQRIPYLWKTPRSLSEQKRTWLPQAELPAYGRDPFLAGLQGTSMAPRGYQTDRKSLDL